MNRDTIFPDSEHPDYSHYNDPNRPDFTEPVLSDSVKAALLAFQQELIWSFDLDIDNIKEFIIQYYSDEEPQKTMEALNTLQFIQRNLRELLPDEL